jgi:hypothetical protein
MYQYILELLSAKTAAVGCLFHPDFDPVIRLDSAGLEGP